MDCTQDCDKVYKDKRQGEINGLVLLLIGINTSLALASNTISNIWGNTYIVKRKKLGWDCLMLFLWSL